MSDAVDKDTLIMLKEVMDDDFGKLVEAYLEDCDQKLPQLSLQLAAREFEQLRRTAHSLKGSSSNFGAARLTDLCGRIELAARDGELAGLDELIEATLAEQQHVALALREFR